MNKRSFAQGTVERLVRGIFAEEFHHLQVLSLALIVLGVVRADRMAIASIGGAMARARGTSPKHGIKQVDRFLSNRKISLDRAFACLARVAASDRRRVVVTMDWTDFDADDQTTICVSLVTRSKRAQPLVWVTVRKSELAGRRGLHERTALEMLSAALPADVRVIVLADRGFGDTDLYDHLLGIPGFDFVVRFRGCIRVEDPECCGPAASLVPPNGRVRLLRAAMLTQNRKGPYVVALYKAAGMKDLWCLATSLVTDDGREIVDLYSRRFECEEAFRDAKDWRFGLGLRHMHIRSPERRDRMLLVFAIGYLLLTLVGHASEKLGIDRTLRANTVRTRTHSLFNQGRKLLASLLPQKRAQDLARFVGGLLRSVLNHGVAHVLA
jgi:hypothetical protein